MFCSIDCDKNYDVESGEIASPLFTSDIGGIYCSYSIKVPEGRRITIEIIKGKSLAQPNCDGYFLSENRFKEKFIVSINNLRVLCMNGIFQIMCDKTVFKM